MNHPAGAPRSGIDGKVNTASHRCENAVSRQYFCEVAA